MVLAASGGGGSCGEVMLRVSAALADPECESLRLERQVGGAEEWTTALEGATPPVTTLAQQAPLMAYRFRLVVVGAAGRSPPSAPTDLVLTDGFHSALLAPPEVSAISARSYAISWAAHTSSCHPDLTYTLQMRRSSATATAPAAAPVGGAGGGTYAPAAAGAEDVADAAEWRTVRERVGRATVELGGVACPEGCAFRYRAEGLRGWARFSQPSASVPTPSVAALPTGGERLACRVDRSLYPPAADAREVAALYAADLASVLEVEPGLLLVHDAGQEAGVVVIDLTPAPADLGAVTPSAQLPRLRQLVLHATAAFSRAVRATREIRRMRMPVGTPETLLAESELRAAAVHSPGATTITLLIILLGVALSPVLLVALRRYRAPGAQHMRLDDLRQLPPDAEALSDSLPVVFTVRPDDAALVGSEETEWECRLSLDSVHSMPKLRRELREACRALVGVDVADLVEIWWVTAEDHLVPVGPRTLLMDLKMEARALRVTARLGASDAT